MDVAKRFAKESYARRLKVGAIVVKDDRIISVGYNGTPAGWNNNCEDESVEININSESLPKLVTKPEVIHAEMNAIAKLAKSEESGDGAYMFITHSPCYECAKLIFTAGIREVFYGEDYRSSDGVNFLTKCGVKVSKLNNME